MSSAQASQSPRGSLSPRMSLSQSTRATLSLGSREAQEPRWFAFRRDDRRSRDRWGNDCDDQGERSDGRDRRGRRSAGERFVAMLRPAPRRRSMRSEMCLRVAKTPGAGIGWRGHAARSAIFVRQSAYGRTSPTNESTQSSHATSRSRSSCCPTNCAAGFQPSSAMTMRCKPLSSRPRAADARARAGRSDRLRLRERRSSSVRGTRIIASKSPTATGTSVSSLTQSRTSRAPLFARSPLRHRVAILDRQRQRVALELFETQQADRSAGRARRRQQKPEWRRP